MHIIPHIFLIFFDCNFEEYEILIKCPNWLRKNRAKTQFANHKL